MSKTSLPNPPGPEGSIGWDWETSGSSCNPGSLREMRETSHNKAEDVRLLPHSEACKSTEIEQWFSDSIYEIAGSVVLYSNISERKCRGCICHEYFYIYLSQIDFLNTHTHTHTMSSPLCSKLSPLLSHHSVFLIPQLFTEEILEGNSREISTPYSPWFHCVASDLKWSHHSVCECECV